jgi:predicted NBD/HSP70 family sugar kinase
MGAALAEYKWGNPTKVDSLVLLYNMEQGVGAGVVIHGQPVLWSCFILREAIF